ncbi:MAG: heme-dependent peroxidase [Actinobacteria bacterium]|nr:heme-dependent peroxidase [Actinomycetota bacterium]MCI0544814.1 heme-dependent peroxidase [Actinomycetota bacterium]
MSAPETLEGWFALHDIRRLDRARWQTLPSAERGRAIAEIVDLLERMSSDPGSGHTVAYLIVGHKADLLLFHLRSEVGELRRLEEAFDRTTLAAFTTRPYSFLSVVEISRHAAPEGGAETIADTPYVQTRLYPEIPAHDGFVCFYPMSKRRGPWDNWYTLTSDERAALMRAHGRTGRRYSGRVTQIVTGAIGLDDWEWGVTLFADDPLVFKKLVYEMRFDEVSARFAEFGPFHVGERIRPDDLKAWLDV